MRNRPFTMTQLSDMVARMLYDVPIGGKAVVNDTGNLAILDEDDNYIGYAEFHSGEVVIFG